LTKFFIWKLNWAEMSSQQTLASMQLVSLHNVCTIIILDMILYSVIISQARWNISIGSRICWKIIVENIDWNVKSSRLTSKHLTNATFDTMISADTCPYYCLYNAPSSRPVNHHDNNNDDNNIMITLDRSGRWCTRHYILRFITYFRARTNTKRKLININK